MTWPTDPSADVAHALATIRRGAAFLGNGLSLAGALPVADADRYRARLTGNGLRELDRFLNLLMDAAAMTAGTEGRPRQANTAERYRARTPAGARTAADHRRLLALGRSRACLLYCDGIVRRPDRRGGATMTLGWPDAGGRLRTASLGDWLRPDIGDLDDIARFYCRLADRVASTPL